MPSVKEQPDSRFLHAENLLQDGVWREYALTITKVIPPGELKYQNGQVADAPVLCFKETQKMFALSAKCNLRLMPYATGTSKPDKWIGKRVTFYAARGNWFNEPNVAAVRVRLPDEGARPKLNPKDLGEDLTGQRVTPLAESKEDQN